MNQALTKIKFVAVVNFPNPAVTGEGIFDLTQGVLYYAKNGQWERAVGDDLITMLAGFSATAPSGTGFLHLTNGVMDQASKLVSDTDVATNAAIRESKLALNYPTHDNANDPTNDEKEYLTNLPHFEGVSTKLFRLLLYTLHKQGIFLPAELKLEAAKVC